MSLSETQQIYEILLKIDQILSGIEVKSERLKTDFSPSGKGGRTLDTLRQLERLAIRWLVLAQRMGLPPEVDKAIGTLSRLIVVLRMVQMASSMLLATNPVTFLIGVAGIAGAALSSVSMLEGY